jgi:general stress protein 26
MEKSFLKTQWVYAALFFLTLFAINVNGQSQQSSIPRDTLIKAALEIMTANPYCALATTDSLGQVQVRTMNPFPLGDEIEIWFATSRKSRKVKQIKRNPIVSVYYADHSAAKGYVNIIGKAVIIDDKDLLIKKKRKYWEGIPNWQENFVLIKITPITLDVTNYARGIYGDPETKKTTTVEFK